MNSSGELEITEDTVLGLIDHKIAEGKKEKNYEDMTIEEIDALEDDEDERVLQVSEQDSWARLLSIAMVQFLFSLT